MGYEESDASSEKSDASSEASDGSSDEPDASSETSGLFGMPSLISSESEQDRKRRLDRSLGTKTVSYTHLTLPTKRIV